MRTEAEPGRKPRCATYPQLSVVARSRQGKIRDRRSRAPARLMYFNTLIHRQSDTLSANGRGTAFFGLHLRYKCSTLQM